MHANGAFGMPNGNLPPGDFDEAMAEAGFHLFHGKANCVACHSSPDLTGPGLFTDITEQPPVSTYPACAVSATRRRISMMPAATLADSVVRLFNCGTPVAPLSDKEQAAVVEYLKNL